MLGLRNKIIIIVIVGAVIMLGELAFASSSENGALNLDASIDSNEALTVFTEQSNYAVVQDKSGFHNFELIINITNNAQKSLWYSSEKAILERQNQNGNWEIVTDQFGIPDDIQGYNIFQEIEPYQRQHPSYYSFTGYLGEKGVYRIGFSYSSHNPWPDIESLPIVYSNEFTVDFSTASAYTQNIAPPFYDAIPGEEPPIIPSEKTIMGELVITTNKMHYSYAYNPSLIDSWVVLHIQNNTSQPIWYSNKYLKLEKKAQDGSWQLDNDWGGWPSDFETYSKINPGEIIEKQLRIVIQRRNSSDINESGIYRIADKYSFQEPPCMFGDLQCPGVDYNKYKPRSYSWTRSNEFIVNIPTPSIPNISVVTSGTLLRQLAQAAKTSASLVLIFLAILALIGYLALMMRIKQLSAKSIETIKLAKAQRIATAFFLILVLLWIGYLMAVAVGKKSDTESNTNFTLEK